MNGAPGGERRREFGRLVVDELGAGGELALVEDAGDEDASSVRPIEDDVLALLETAQPGGQLAAGPPDAWLLSKQIEAVQQEGEVPSGLFVAPFVRGVKKNFGEVRACVVGELPGAQALRLSPA